MIELLVGDGDRAGRPLGLTMLILVTLHGSARVSARVDATQRARVAVTK